SMDDMSVSPQPAVTSSHPSSASLSSASLVLSSQLTHTQLQLHLTQQDLHLSRQLVSALQQQNAEAAQSIASHKLQLTDLQQQLTACKLRNREERQRADVGTAELRQQLHQAAQRDAEWQDLTASVERSKQTIKSAKDDVARKAKLLAAANELHVQLQKQLQ